MARAPQVSETTVRPARADEQRDLTALCLRSKAHWGYDAEFMRLCASVLEVSEAAIAEGRVLVAVDGHGALLGTASVSGERGTGELELMFIEPSAIGMGIGRRLFDEAVKLARGLGLERLTILADVNAAPFYERMGARFVKQAPSDAIPGRMLPFYEYHLAREHVS